jgi:hypothetical protein
MRRAAARHAGIASSGRLFGVVTLGKTLNLIASPLFAVRGEPAMYSLLAQLARFLPAAPAQNGVARRLMETAEARAGTDPRQAQELRIAASAYLRVVR